MPEAACPLCNEPIRLDESHCSNCGVDLALVATLSERALLSSSPRLPALRVTPEVLVPRLGERLVEQGVLDLQQLDEALQFQQAQAAAGSPTLIGQTLIQLGFIDTATLDRAVTQQIFHLQDALRRANRELENRVRERTHDLQEAMERLSELGQLKANLIANISHELRTPLTHIKGYTEMLADSSLGPVTEDQVSAFKVMERSIRRLESLIDDLIRFSDSAQGEITLHVRPFSVRHVFMRATAQARARSSAGSVSLVTELPEGTPSVLGDLDKIAWVVFHLIDNAIKFTPAGGTITIAADEVEGRVRFTVSDTGIGIQADKLEEIFEPFHQLESASTRRYGGTGLGLALVKRILQAHNTDIGVDSTFGKGSTFWFHLPATDQKQVASS